MSDLISTFRDAAKSAGFTSCKIAVLELLMGYARAAGGDDLALIEDIAEAVKELQPGGSDV
jgi:hypothetical protein